MALSRAVWGCRLLSGAKGQMASDSGLEIEAPALPEAVRCCRLLSGAEKQTASDKE